MKQIALLLPLALLAACGQEAEVAPAAAETVAAAPEPVSTLPAPDQQTFSNAFAVACEGAKPVNTAVCKRAGIGSKDVICEYGLGDDEYLRNKATLTANEDSTGWVLADPTTVCAATGA
ncbi:hypothetical protein [Erythrobacter mangrovi]|uniref:hypothetical protein n=1 Tax=Erythrobacter mangrovi TaxID=2739433 RepID=UPI001F3B9E1D|nr:hypothetical protein [Erythrobacter mangrovi]